MISCIVTECVKKQLQVLAKKLKMTPTFRGKAASVLQPLPPTLPPPQEAPPLPPLLEAPPPETLAIVPPLEAPPPPPLEAPPPETSAIVPASKPDASPSAPPKASGDKKLKKDKKHKKESKKQKKVSKKGGGTVKPLLAKSLVLRTDVCTPQKLKTMLTRVAMDTRLAKHVAVAHMYLYTYTIG